MPSRVPGKRRAQRRTRGHEALLDEVETAWRRLSGAMVAFQSSAADLLGIGVTDIKAVDLLSRTGPMTAGELAAGFGVTAGAVTGLLDRLERAGLVVREKDPSDARRLVIRMREPRAGAHAGGQPVPALLRELRKEAAAFSQSELAAIVDFMGRSERVLRKQAEVLRGR
jgi:DNA-binding MarR family transcriptional regulator